MPADFSTLDRQKTFVLLIAQSVIHRLLDRFFNLYFLIEG